MADCGTVRRSCDVQNCQIPARLSVGFGGNKPVGFCVTRMVGIYITYTLGRISEKYQRENGGSKWAVLFAYMCLQNGEEAVQKTSKEGDTIGCFLNENISINDLS